MCNDSSAKYYQNKEERLQKKLIKIFLMKKQTLRKVTIIKIIKSTKRPSNILL